ncbi:MAG: hypothetical protein A2020_10350 [Lentisphaerae bacterium GWF2_45_14]|nr:MAG: hypothetical protein A2020_10350 [Lentisphaerae bacterium GWF2_45_14]
MGKGIQEIHRMTTAESVIKSLESFIISNSLKPGMSLPSEHELAGSLGVSRNILREGLQYFKTLGIIGTKPKTGGYIKSLTPLNPFGGYMPFMHNNNKVIREISQLRMIIELGIVPLLIKNISKENIERLQAIALQMAKAHRVSRRRLECEFHSYMLEIVNNELLSGFKPLLTEFFENNNMLREEDEENIPELMSNSHMAIVEALKSKDEEELRRITRAHYEAYMR